LGKLLDLYSDWHSRLLPYYSFNQFVNKVEKVAATRRVKVTASHLRYYNSSMLFLYVDFEGLFVVLKVSLIVIKFYECA